MFAKLVLLLAVVAVASANRVNIRACPGGAPMPAWFESNDCTTTRCTLRRGQVFTGRAQFTPAQAFSALTVTVSASLLGIPFPLNIPAGYENACNFLEAGATCPVSAGGTYIWALQFPIQSDYPAASNLIINRKFIKLIEKSTNFTYLEFFLQSELALAELLLLALQLMLTSRKK